MSWGRIRRDPLDALFSDYIRKRAGWCCERCGICPSRRGLDCSHFHGRAKQAVRYDEDNAVALCKNCHRYFGSHKTEYEDWFKQYIGEERYNMLEGRMRQIGKPDKNALKLYYKQKITELDAIDT